MLSNYFKTAIRSLLRERYYTLIKIIGLALGLGTSMVLLLYVSFQLSFDKFHPDIDRQYRINQTNIWDPNGGIFGSTGPAVSIALAEDFPEIEEVMRVNTPGGNTITYQEPNGNVLAFNEGGIFAADSNFFHFFDFKLKEGDRTTALIGKDKVVISDDVAKKFFGNEPALGKFLQMGADDSALTDGSAGAGTGKRLLEVTGVTEKQPKNSHFNFDYLLSMETNPNVKRFEWSWIWTQVVTHVKLRPGADVTALEEKLKTFADRHAPACFKILGMDYNEFLKSKGPWKLYLQPMQSIYLHSGAPFHGASPIGNRIGPNGDIKYVYILSVVALFILLIAVINFVNLSTARGAKRAKEVGVKKTLGLMRNSLIAQFQVEHILLTAISMLFGMGFMELLRLLIQPVIGIEIPLSAWSPVTFVVLIISLPIIIGFLAGLYPSFYLTAFKPAAVLKGRLASGFGSSGLRNGLVIFQFTISIALMAGTIIVFDQVEFFRSKELGFNKENLLIIRNAEKTGVQLESFRNEISKYPGIISASVSANIRGGMQDVFMREGDEKKVTMDHYKIDEYFMETMKLAMASGRNFDVNRPSDVNAVIINETSARQLGWTPEESIGKRILYLGDQIGPQEVIGVVKDFHFQSLRQNIAPLIFFHQKSNMYGDGRVISIKYETGQSDELLAKVETRWRQLVNNSPFEYFFLDEQLRRLYNDEQQLGSLFSVFTGLSITIAVIGLVGLVAYSAEQRKKEIGIRKVFGASLTSIYVMINTQYIRLVLVSLVIATPAAWWLMQQWLESYPYQTPISIWTFISAGAAEMILALVCVGYLALRAASLNPSAVLKEE
jgi:putative ABC transport system permease protein